MKKWHHLHVSTYRHNFHIIHVSGGGGGLEVGSKKSVRPMDSLGASSFCIEKHGKMAMEWGALIKSSRKWLEAENTEVSSMTAADYFQYCRIAYIAGKRKDETVDESLSGREMYCRYADGRHEGILDIDPASKQEFADRIDGTHPKRGAGGHPWEIKRGGNTTHIDLAVSRPSVYRREAFKVGVKTSIGPSYKIVAWSNPRRPALFFHD
jgi:hypothetical protein